MANFIQRAWRRAASSLFGEEINRRISAAVDAVDRRSDVRLLGAGSGRDNFAQDRVELMRDAMEAWRTNPLAHRIVSLTTEYVVSDIKLACEHKRTNDFLQAWWEHPQNRMAIRCQEWCDELTRAGDLFPLISTDAAGMSFMRAIPSYDGETWGIEHIDTAENDVENELKYRCVSTIDGKDAITYKAFKKDGNEPNGNGEFEPVMLHYAVNRPVGAQWGESDLGSLVRWLKRYSQWLEDRVRLNRFRNIFMYVVKRAFSNDAEREAYEAQLNSHPPQPGAIKVLNSKSNEEWEVISAKLSSIEANKDGLTLKKMVAVGAGLPMHFLSEPESATRTTAIQSGSPTYRHYESRQQYFLWMLSDIIRVVLARRKAVDKFIKTDIEVIVTGADVSARDNAALAIASERIVRGFAEMR
ncbi:MAG: hypothetical protein ABFR47_09215, partial [Verrucomicrobiota bacterium]